MRLLLAPLAPLALIALIALIAACGDTATVTIDPMGTAECELHCAETIEVTLGSESRSAPCGEAITFEGVPVGDQVPIRVTVSGGIALSGAGFVVAASGKPVELSVPLTADERPSVERIDQEGAVIYGSRQIDVIGDGFGSGAGESRVTVAGATVAIDRSMSSDGHLSITVDEVGPLVVTNCGVSSDPFPLPLQELVVETYQYSGQVCMNARVLAGDSASSSDGRATAVLACGECNKSLVVEIDPMVDAVSSYVAQINAGCVVDVARVEADAYLVVAPNGVRVCRVLDGMFDCELLDESSVTDVTRAGRALGAYVRTATETGSEPYVVETDPPDDPERLLPDDVRDAVAVEGNFILGSNFAGNAILVEWKRPPPTGALQPHPVLVGCTTPLALRTQRADGIDHVVAVCKDGTELQISALGEETTGFEGLRYQDAALDVAGRVLWLWTGAEMVFVDIAEGEELGRMSLPPRADDYKGARLLRASNVDRFILGGPARGQITRLFIE